MLRLTARFSPANGVHGFNLREWQVTSYYLPLISEIFRHDPLGFLDFYACSFQIFGFVLIFLLTFDFRFNLYIFITIPFSPQKSKNKKK